MTVLNESSLDVGSDWQIPIVERAKFKVAEYNLPQLVDLLYRLPASYHDDYTKWLKVLILLYRIDPGLQWLAEHWSRQSSKYHPGDVESKWQSFSKDPEGDYPKLGSLIHWVRSDSGVPEGVSEALDDERRLARVYFDRHKHPEGLGLRFYGDSVWTFKDGWREHGPEDVKADLYEVVKNDFERAAKEMAAKSEEPVKLAKVSDGLLGNIDTAMRSIARFDSSNVPCWVDGSGDDGHHLTFRNGILALDPYFAGRTKLQPLTPRYFSPYGLPYDFEHTDREPTALLTLLNEQCQQDEIDFIQEFWGLCYIPETKYERALFLKGPKRSGKGTLIKAMIKSIGARNHVAKDLFSFHEKFALDNVHGKLLLSFPDERQERKQDTAGGVSRLLKLIGGDPIDVQTKYATGETRQLVARAIIAANYFPNLPDESGALRARLTIVETRKSHAGNEDRNLLAKVTDDMPAIACWALRGLKRLKERGDFAPVSNRSGVEYAIANSPITTFVDSCCVRDGVISKAALYAAYKEFIELHNHEPLDEVPFFKQLYQNFPTLTPTKPRDGESRVPSVKGLSLKDQTNE